MVKSIFCNFVSGLNDMKDMESLWTDLKSLRVVQVPRIILCDFDALMKWDDRIGQLVRGRGGRRYFDSVVNSRQKKDRSIC